MQIDFHHGATYAVARMAGFTHTQASIIAHAAQYVDDNTETGFIRFDNEMRYFRQATAHPVFDLDNMDDDTDAESWLPFHFLPGNQPSSASAPYIERLICRPASPIALEMLQMALADRAQPWGLHRLGIVAHVFIDTFAHQGFAGLNDDINEAGGFQHADGNSMAVMPLPIPPVGHGQARTFPDMPYLAWSYEGHGGIRVSRDNPRDFLQALELLLSFFQQWRGVAACPMAPADRAAVMGLIAYEQEEEDKRHQAWIDAIAGGQFAFGAQAGVSYDPKQWDKDALGSATLSGPLPWSPQFLTSDLKLFHDAAKRQRHDVIVILFPKHGILEG
jgi:hypothetical protein